MKKVMLFTAAAVMILALAAVGCGKIEESNSMMSIVIEPSFEEDKKVVIQLKSGAENENADALPDTENPDYEIMVTGSGVVTCTVDPGSYRVTVLPEKNTNGTINMTVQRASVETQN